MFSRFRGSTALAAAVLGASALLLSACHYHTPGGLYSYSLSYRSYYGGHHGYYKRPHFRGHGHRHHHHRKWRRYY